MYIYYHTEADTAELDEKKAPIQIINIEVSNFIENGNDGESDKDGDDINFAYETRRAFFTKMGILNWCTKVFPDYETTLATGLLEGDPSFLVNLKNT